MPKASKGRKKTTKIGTVQQRPSQPIVQTGTQTASVSTTAASPARARRASQRNASTGSMLTLVFPAMVALGCWGMAFTLAYFYSDPNRYLYAGMAALMGLFWTYSLYIRYTRIQKARKAK